MDVTFTNVLEGARQYFQGLPATGVGSTAAGPYYSQDSTQPNSQNDQNQNVPQASNLYWTGQQNDPSRPPTREHIPIQRPSSHNSDGSRPPSHPHYTQEPNRQQYIGSYEDQQPSSQAPAFHFPRPHSREAPSNQQYQSHAPTSSPFQAPSPQMPRAPSRESRPQSREAPSVTQQYHNQSYVPTSSYQPASPQLPRVPSREQLAQPTPSQSYTQSPQSQNFHQSYPTQQRSYYPVQQQPQVNKASTNNFKPVTSTSSASYPTMTPRNNYYKTSYSPQAQMSHMQQDAYANSRSVNYAESAQNTQPTSLSNDTSYQSHRPTHTLPPVASVPTFPTSSRSSREPAGRTATNPPQSRAPHNISTNQNCTPSNHPSVLQTSGNNASKSRSYSSSNNYHQSFRNYINTNPQNYSYTATTTTQAYNSVIMTTSSYYSISNQNQSTSQPVYSTKSSVQTSAQAPATHYNVLHQSEVSSQPTTTEHQNQNTQMVKQKREISPLDLSVKTVRTPADSTLEEAEAHNKYFHRPAHSSISNHSYPTVDVNSFHRSFNQKSFQLPTASAPKVEFVPNFNVSTAGNLDRPFHNHQRPEEYQPNCLPEKIHNNSVRPEYKGMPYTSSRTNNRYPTVTVPSSAHMNSYIQSPQGPAKSVPIKANSIYPYHSTEVQKKRLGEVGTSTIPNKIPKIESWRHSIDMQIDQKLAAAKLQQMHQTSTKPTLVNGGYSSLSQERLPQEIPVYPKQNYEASTQHHYNNTANHYYGQVNHNQTYVPSPVGNQYPGYPTYNSQTTQNHHLNSSAKLNSNPVVPTVNKQNHVGVLDLLRTSLAVKGQKKLEQLKSQDVAHHPRSDVQHPNTDVTAPLQPKPGIISRNNVSPFTPTHFPDNNVSPLYKFQIPKAMESINYEADAKETPALDKQMENIVIPSQTGQNNEFDGLAAFLAARIRTKGELKQVGSSQTSNNNSVNESRIQSIGDNRSKSPTKIDVQAPQGPSIFPTSINAPKLPRDKLNPYAPRKRLFSRNEEDFTTSSVPHRDKSGLRSSSETSVFDFPDSDSETENPVLERQSLEAMRRDRKSSIKQNVGIAPVEDMKDVKPDVPPRTPSPEDDIFAQLCDNFVEQLKYSPKKKTRRKKVVEPEVLAKLETVVTENPLDPDITIKIEPTQKSDDIVETKCEKEEVNELKVPEVVQIKKETDDSALQLLGNKIITNEMSDCDVIIKEEEVLVVERRLLGARRKLSSSEESSDSEIEIDKKKEYKETEKKKEIAMTEAPEKDKEEAETGTKSVTDSPKKLKEVVVPVVRPAKKPSFGTGSDFYPGWEEGVYKYKKSLRMPPTLIQVTRPPASMRLSTSLPDLDPCPQSPTASITNDSETKETTPLKKTIKKIKSEPIDSDSESTGSFNIFSKKTNYDSEGSASVKSLPNIKKENSSILDKLLQKYGGRKRRRYKRKDDHSPKVIPKAEKQVELLPTPSLEVKNKGDGKELKKLKTSVIKRESAVLGFRKDTINNFKDAFINSSSSLLGVHDKFAAVVLKSRTRKETRVMKQNATIKEVFGEDRPASAPPVTCINDIEIKKEVLDDDIIPIPVGKTKLSIKKEVIIEARPYRKTRDKEVSNSKQVLKDKLLSKGKKKDAAKKVVEVKEIKTELEDSLDEDSKSLDSLIKKELDARCETLSLDGDEGSITGKKRGKLGKMRRKFSSGFDYIRKKKKIKKELVETDLSEKKKKKVVTSKAPESVDDIQKEIKTWVLNKGIGETHLHRAARLGYTDITAYCLEKMDCSSSPKDNAGYTPLHEACSRGHLHIAKLLLKYGANVHESAQGGIRPLHEAVENGFVEIVRLLLSYGADASLATYTGITPLMLASDETTKILLKNHLEDIQGGSGSLWEFIGPASCFDAVEEIGYNVLDDPPKTDSEPEEESIEIEMSETLLPNLYTLRGEPPSDRWVLLQDLSNLLKIKSRDALLRQICAPSTSGSANFKSVLRELKMSDFLEQARCCQFLNQGEKINTRASKIALVKYTDKVKQLLGIEVVSIKNR